jgi:AmmeMemoRadiSam system protein A
MSGKDEQELLVIAREAIASHLAGRSFQPGPVERTLEEQGGNGVFVTLWSQEAGRRQLRGCIGRFEREFELLSRDIASCAVLAAVRDPRFLPVRPDELAGLAIEISLLGPNETVVDTSQLDPSRYGVIMTSRESGRQATLLPAIEGVDTVEQQLAIVRRKAGIGPEEKVSLERYTVRKLSE